MASPELRAVRAVLRGRRDRADGAEMSYRIYLAVMLAVIVGAPLVRGLVLWNLETLPLPSAAPGGVVAPWLTGLTAVCVLAGAQGGPARAGLPQLDLLYSSAIPRHRLLSGPVARAIALGAGVGAFAAGIVATTRLVRGDTDAELTVALLLGGAALGVFAAVGMLLGQLGRRVRWAVAAGLAVIAALQWGWGLSADPWSWVAGLVTRESGAGALERADSGSLLVGAGILVGCAIVLTSAAPRLAARLRWEALRDQAARWDAIGTSAASGDPKAALARLGAPVWLGRSWRLKPSRNLTMAILQRDALGLLRTPARSLLACGGVAAAALLWCLALGAGTSEPGAPDLMRAAALGAPAMLLAMVALQSWCRGLSTAADGSGSAALVPLAPQALMARHLLVPLLLGLLASFVGGIVALSLPGVERACEAGWMLGSCGMLIGGALSLRVLASLKGTIPLRVLAPVPTPMGDASGINVLLWTLDGSITAVIVGAVLAPLWIVGISAGGIPVTALLVSAVAIGGVLLWARVRLAN